MPAKKFGNQTTDEQNGPDYEGKSRLNGFHSGSTRTAVP